jgi:hypothetical protein
MATSGMGVGNFKTENGVSRRGCNAGREASEAGLSILKEFLLLSRAECVVCPSTKFFQNSATPGLPPLLSLRRGCNAGREASEAGLSILKEFLNRRYRVKTSNLKNTH